MAMVAVIAAVVAAGREAVGRGVWQRQGRRQRWQLLWLLLRRRRRQQQQ